MLTPTRRRLLLAALGGLCWALAHPPFGLWWTSFGVVPLLLGALHDDDLRPWGAAARGAVTGGVAFAIILVWTSNITPGGWAAWPLLVAVQAAWVAAFAVLARPWARRSSGVAVVPLLYVGVEVLRGSVPLGGFGWAELSYAHAGTSWLSDMARVVGGRGITLTVALLGTLLYEAWRRGHEAIKGLEGTPLERASAYLPHAQPALLGLAATMVVSVLATVGPPATVGEIDVLLVQGNGTEHWDVPGREVDRLVAQSHLDLTRTAIASDGLPDLVVWPESSVDDDPRARPDLAAILDEAAALAEGRLVVGAHLDGPRPRTFRNTVLHVADDGTWLDAYDKRHLVPFGEFVPWRSVLGGFGPLRAVPTDAIPGDGPGHLHVDGVGVAAIVCFETLFGDLVRENVLGDAADGEDPAHLIVAATNDASFGRGAESDQHVAQSRLRAVETGRWVIHAAVSGGSALVDPDGGVHHATELFDATTVRATVPLVEGSTPFLLIGDLLGRLASLVAVAEAVRRTVRRLVKRRSRTS